MGVIQVTGVPCSQCGERTWYKREPEEKRLTGRNVLALALIPLNFLEYVASYSRRSPLMAHARYERYVKDGVTAAELKAGRVQGVDVVAGEMVCASCSHIHRAMTGAQP
jgi:hypothetical protein